MIAEDLVRLRARTETSSAGARRGGAWVGRGREGGGELAHLDDVVRDVEAALGHLLGRWCGHGGRGEASWSGGGGRGGGEARGRGGARVVQSRACVVLASVLSWPVWLSSVLGVVSGGRLVVVVVLISSPLSAPSRSILSSFRARTTAYFAPRASLAAELRAASNPLLVLARPPPLLFPLLASTSYCAPVAGPATLFAKHSTRGNGETGAERRPSPRSADSPTNGPSPVPLARASLSSHRLAA